MKWLLTTVGLLCLCALMLHCTEAAAVEVERCQENDAEVEIQGGVDVTANYLNQVIYIESRYERGRWLFANDYDAGDAAYYVFFPRYNEDQVIDIDDLKWMVEDGGNGSVVLRNLKYDRHYLTDTVADHFIKALHNYSCDPKEDDDLKFQFFYNEHGHQYHTIKQANKWFHVCCDWYASISTKLYEPDAYFRIYQPQKSSSYKVIAKIENYESVPILLFYQKTIGISRSNHTRSASASIGMEIKSALSAAGTEYSEIWKTQVPMTYSEALTTSVQLEVPAHKKMIVKQLVGQYGPYEIRATTTHVRTEDI